MKNTKFLVAFTALLGLAALFVPRAPEPSVFSTWLARDRIQLAIVLLVFVLPLVAASISIIRPPFRRWNATISLTGFVLGLGKTRIWEVGADVLSQPVAFKLLVVATVVGTVASALAVAKPESRT